ncbi:MAG: 4'-phosphopantetheinyl transferase superfamily protein [Treponema sp.]|nr:4'-phosphopantetheinyl transferase superfamily protein [Treponema sp.]
MDGGARTGCDVQFVDAARRYEGVCREFFRREERGYVEAAANALDAAARFCRIWALKEAFLKARGLSVTDFARAPAFSARAMGLDASGMEFFVYDVGDASCPYVCAAALEGAATGESRAPELRWYSAGQGADGGTASRRGGEGARSAGLKHHVEDAAGAGLDPLLFRRPVRFLAQVEGDQIAG